SGNDVSYPNAEVEPFVAVNPTDPDNVVGVFQQDRWQGGGARGLVAAYSNDGGQSWDESLAGFDQCAEPTSQLTRASDPWVSFDAGGRAYQSGLVLSSDGVVSGVVVSTSTDGGANWDAPKSLILDDATSPNFNDKPSITGDPTRVGYAYATWDRLNLPDKKLQSQFHTIDHAFAGRTMVSRTTDGGAHWSTPTALFTKSSNVSTLANQIAVLPDGSLVDIFLDYRASGLQPSAGGYYTDASISHDAGLTWSDPIHIAAQQKLGVDVDPDTGQGLRVGDGFPDVAVDPHNGKLYVVWTDRDNSTGSQARVRLSSSTNGGRTWSNPASVNQTPIGDAAFTPSAVVSSDGTISVDYYDFRTNTPGPGLPTDLWLASSHDGGTTWSEQKVYGPFDLQAAPQSSGLFLGDYSGLTETGQDILAFFTRSNSSGPDNRTDIVAVLVTPN
ncbi:MAG: sialidase family protein, partial [Marmoricola sp.]